MTIRFATTQEEAQWNALVLKNSDSGNVFQSYEFAEQKRLGGWRPRFIVANDTAITVLEKSLPMFGKVWYLPKGPGISSIRELDELLQELKDFARTQGVFTIKTEPELLKNPETLADMMKLGLVKTTPIQPNFSTVVLDLTSSLDDILTAMPQKGRHAIRRAERDGVIIKQVPASDENCKIMFDLLQATALDSKFGIRPPAYYKAYWQTFAKKGLGQLFFAYYDNQVVAGAYAFIYGHKSTYKDGASIRKRTAYGASHLLQWHVIAWAKEHGSTWHDLCGAPPADRIKDATHPHYGIGLFKTQFNKEITEYVGAYDIPIVDWKYQLWHQYLEKLVRKIYYETKHESYY